MGRESSDYSREADHEIAALRKDLAALKAEVKPILDMQRASKIVGKILIIIGGLLVGGATIFSAVSDYFRGH